MNLTQQQENFCLKYTECGNASEAYRCAYPKSQKWAKDKAVWEKASLMLSNAKVSQRIAELKAKAAERSAITKDDIVNLNIDIVNADVFDYLELKGQDIRFKDIMELPPEKRRLIESVTLNSIGAPVLKLCDKSKAIERLNKMLGFDAPTQMEHSGKGGGNLLLELLQSKENKDNDG